ncbi:hypothetical protein U1Q18_031607 [Sarracenia purpurea var. burkii]
MWNGVQLMNHFLAPAPEEETAAKKRGAKLAKVTEESETIEQRALAAASLWKH